VLKVLGCRRCYQCGAEGAGVPEVLPVLVLLVLKVLECRRYYRCWCRRCWGAVR